MEPLIANYVLYGVAGASLIATVVFAALGRSLGWRASLIVMVLSLFAAELIPPKEQLRPGIDIAGGVSLLYEVDVSGSRNPTEDLEDVLELLKKRVDPANTANIEWRVESGNRIEIRMPLAGPIVKEKRAEFDTAMEQIVASNISKARLLAALDAGTSLSDFEGDVPGRADRLDAAQAARRALDIAAAEYEKLKDPDAAADDLRYAEALQAFDIAIAAVMATNIDEVLLRRALGQSTGLTKDSDVSPREAELNRLKAQHADRADELDQLVVVYDAYQDIKGPLDDANDLKRLLRGAGVLEFRITVSPGLDQVDDAQIQRMRGLLTDQGPNLSGPEEHKWYRINSTDQWIDTAAHRVEFNRDPIEFFSSAHRIVAGEYGGEFYVLLWDRDDYTLTRSKPNWALAGVRSTVQDGYPAIGFEMNGPGAKYLGRLTDDNLKRQMAIVLDDQVYSAPTIQSRISKSGVISGGRGGFSQQELTYLKRTLKAGGLKAALSEEPISERTISNYIGAKALSQGLKSTVYALIAVAAFMALYYLFAGSVANLALLANLVIVLGVMATREATFTLPGIAGLVLTIGMCVDANVLIFERIREELGRGADMPTALRLGYGRALSAIIDGNVTNLIVCVILGLLASQEVVGFAKVFGIGIVSTLFTSLFMTRVIFDVWTRFFGMKRLSMVPTLVPAVGKLLRPSVNWVRMRPMFFVISFVAVIGGITLITQRGVDMMDIEFRSGTEVAFSLRDGQLMTVENAQARVTEVSGWFAEGFDVTSLTEPQRDQYERIFETIAAAELQTSEPIDLTVLADAAVVGLGEQSDAYTYAGFSIVSSVPSQKPAAALISAAFADVIDVQTRLRFQHNNLVATNLDDLPSSVKPITQTWLGDVINRPGQRVNVSDHFGGVAIVVEDMTPAVGVDEVSDRIKTMRRMPDYANHPYVPTEVIGLDAVPGDPDRFTSVAVIGHLDSVSFDRDAGKWAAVLAVDEWNLVRDALAHETSLDKVSNFTPTVARTIQRKATVALLLSFLAIVAYIWFRFGSLRYGLAAIAALLHDVIIVVGLVAMSGLLYRAMGDSTPLLIEPFRLNMNLIAALLTIIGYSLNDTIVVFDRIREVRGKLAHVSPDIVNAGINQCISRTLLTSFTTFLAVGVMYVFGGPGIRDFAFAVMCGVIVGTYSSIAIASPILLIGAGKSGAPARRDAGSPAGSPATA